MILVKMEKEERFYSIDAAIELVRNEKYEDVVTTTVNRLETRKEKGSSKVNKAGILHIPTYKGFKSVETTNEQKQEGILNAIENLKSTTTALMESRSAAESNLLKLERHIKTLDKLQVKGVIANDDESIQVIKAQAAKRLSENPKGELEKEIDEILGDPIEEIEIPIEDVPAFEGPQGNKPEEPGEEKEK